jgi:hypothetical protein
MDRDIEEVIRICFADANKHLKEQPMGRKVFTYKDVKEAEQYQGKTGYFSNILSDLENNTDKSYAGTLYVPWGKFGFPFGCKERNEWFQFFSPEPIPVEKWVPFTAEDWELFMGKVVRTKSSKTVGGVGVQGFSSIGVEIWPSIACTFKEFLENWTFLDGPPCGKKVVG